MDSTDNRLVPSHLSPPDLITDAASPDLDTYQLIALIRYILWSIEHYKKNQPDIQFPEANQRLDQTTLQPQQQPYYHHDRMNGQAHLQQQMVSPLNVFPPYPHMPHISDPFQQPHIFGSLQQDGRGGDTLTAKHQLAAMLSLEPRRSAYRRPVTTNGHVHDLHAVRTAAGARCMVRPHLDSRSALPDDFGFPLFRGASAPGGDRMRSATSVIGATSRGRPKHHHTPWGLREGENDRMVYVSWLPRIARAEDCRSKRICELDLKARVQRSLSVKGLVKVILYPPSSAHCKLLFKTETHAKEFLLMYGGREGTPGPERWKRSIASACKIDLLCPNITNCSAASGILATPVRVVWADASRPDVPSIEDQQQQFLSFQQQWWDDTADDCSTIETEISTLPEATAVNLLQTEDLSRPMSESPEKTAT